jgi:type II secretory ATPase GspE/PulE/Tfp pilus assembly ATPase PilB-like protein
MGIDDYLMASTLHVIVGQRLVRKLCVVCRESYSPGGDLYARLAVTPYVVFRIHDDVRGQRMFAGLIADKACRQLHHGVRG